MRPRGQPVAIWALVLCAVAFALLTWGVVAGAALAGLDDDVERAVTAHRVGWATALLKVLTWLGSSVVLWPVVGLAAVFLVVSSRTWGKAAFLVVSFGGSVGLSDLVKAIVGRPRPPPSVRLIAVSGSSYPSGHAMDVLTALVALAIVFWADRSRPAQLGLITGAALVILVVGWSRLYLGEHWLSDVLGGYALGGLWVAIVAMTVLRPGAAPARTAPYPPGPGR